jgi:transcriptional regulator with XRE-family HTH domain
MSKQPESFGARLAAARLTAGKTQGEVGEVAGVSGAAVSAWEVDRTQPSAKQLASVCNLLRVSADYLLGRQKARV